MTFFNNKTCVTSEYVVLTQDIATYKWIFHIHVHMVPVFSIGSIRLIFCDGKITERITIELGIKETCVFRYDYYYVMNEIWHNKHNFGI